MALLPDLDRAAISALIQTDLSRERLPLALTKADLRAAINAVDQWAEDNATAYNQALPVAARTALTAKQKAQLLMYVLRRRYEVI